MDHCIQSNFTDSNCFENYEYFSDLLYVINNCLSNSVDWSLDGRYLKINYRQFEQEYLSTHPIICENVFSFIYQMESFGFIFISDPYVADLDELVFIKLDDYDHFHRWNNLSCNYEEIHYPITPFENIFSGYCPLSSGESLPDDSVSSCCRPNNCKCHQQVFQGTPQRQKKSHHPRRFQNYHKQIPKVKSRDSTPNSLPGKCNRRKIKCKRKLLFSEDQNKKGGSRFKDLKVGEEILLQDDDSQGVFTTDTSRDVMLCQGCELNSSLTQYKDEFPIEENTNCICPEVTKDSFLEIQAEFFNSY